jgi:Grx4 family monothiol glutaredoxin
MSTLIEITSQDDLSSHVAAVPSSALVVLYFYTPWTAFSTDMTANLTSLTSQYPATTPPSISFLAINAKSLLDTAKDYGVRAAPCVVCLRGGQVLETIKGSDATKIRDALDKHGAVTAPVVDSPPVATEEEKDALTARLTELVRAAPVMLFMKGTPKSPRCRFSRRLVGILEEHGIEYGSFDVMSDEDVRQGIKEFGDWPTFPQLWVDGELVGGLDVVSAPESDYRAEVSHLVQC